MGILVVRVAFERRFLRLARRHLLGAAVAAVLGCPALGQEAPGIDVTLGLSAQTDSNLLRLPDGVSPRVAGLDHDQRGDELLVPFALLDGAIIWSRQKLLLHAGARRMYYHTYGNFDAHITDYRGTWRWESAEGWDGELVGGREQQVTSFEDFVGTQRNVLAITSLNGRVNWRPRSDRRVSLLYDDFRGANSQDARRPNDYRVRSERLELAATSAHGNEIALGVRYTNGDYPNRIILALAPVDNSYHQTTVDLAFTYNPGGRTRLDARGGYAWRRHDEVPERNFNARVGHFLASWEATSKLVLDAEAGRDVDAVDDFDRIFAVTTTSRAGLKFQASSKIALAAGWQRRKIDYRGDPANFLSLLFPTAPREDALHDRTLSAIWVPAERWQLDASYQWLDRTSNRPELQFRARVLQLTSQYRW